MAVKDTWQAKVQLRQRCDVPRTLLALEQAISRHGIARDVVEVKRSREGLDLTFAKAQHAQRFVGAAGGRDSNTLPTRPQAHKPTPDPT